MSIDIKLDGGHDLAMSRSNDLVLIDGAERVRQQIEITLQTWLGEWFLDTSFGVPYLERVLVKSPSRAQIESVMRAKVKAVPGVVAVPTIGIEIDGTTRRARIALPNIETNEGLVTVSVIN